MHRTGGTTGHQRRAHPCSPARRSPEPLLGPWGSAGSITSISPHPTIPLAVSLISPAEALVGVVGVLLPRNGEARELLVAGPLIAVCALIALGVLPAEIDPLFGSQAMPVPNLSRPRRAAAPGTDHSSGPGTRAPVVRGADAAPADQREEPRRLTHAKAMMIRKTIRVMIDAADHRMLEDLILSARISWNESGRPRPS